jgi:hypothetical protein
MPFELIDFTEEAKHFRELHGIEVGLKTGRIHGLPMELPILALKWDSGCR